MSFCMYICNKMCIVTVLCNLIASKYCYMLSKLRGPRMNILVILNTQLTMQRMRQPLLTGSCDPCWGHRIHATTATTAPLAPSASAGKHEWGLEDHVRTPPEPRRTPRADMGRQGHWDRTQSWRQPKMVVGGASEVMGGWVSTTLTIGRAVGGGQRASWPPSMVFFFNVFYLSFN